MKRTKKQITEESSPAELYAPEGEESEETYDDSYYVRWAAQCKGEAQTAKFDRMQKNKLNLDLYHSRHDFSHKLPGQSRETLNMQAMAVESTVSFFQQALIDEGDWWGLRALDKGADETQMKVAPDIVKDITQHELDKAKMLRHVGLGIKQGLLEALWVTKVTGKYAPVQKYVVNRDPNSRKARMKKVTKKGWQLDLQLVDTLHYYPDPTGAGLYEIEEMYVDYHVVCEQAKGKDAIYDEEAVEQIQFASDAEDSEEQLNERRKTDQNTVSHDFRKRVKITEYWGDILGDEGEVLHENVVMTIANDTHLIRKPTPNPLWHQESPYVRIPIIDLDAVWPKALSDAGTRHNIALNEIYNLMLDGGMRAVNGVGQIRVDWIDNPEDIEDGINPGTTLKVNSQCPPGGKAYEVTQSGTLPPDAQNMFNIQRQEFNASMLTSDIRSGIQPRRDVPATQIVETSQSITSVFKGICEQVEQNGIKVILQKAVATVCQFSDEIDETETRAVLGDRADAWMKLTPEERFAETVQGVKFDVYGISQQLAKAQDFQKIATLLQTIGASQPFMEAFIGKYSPDKVLLQAMKALGINVRQIEIPQAQQDMMKQQAQGGGDQPPAPQGPDQMSQVTSPNTGSLADQLGSAAGPQIPQAAFPKSKATPHGGM